MDVIARGSVAHIESNGNREINKIYMCENIQDIPVMNFLNRLLTRSAPSVNSVKFLVGSNFNVDAPER